jgi:glycosyltransferase involved in cell wall biosynthesis
MKKKIVLITSFFESPFHKNRAPYNEQLFRELKADFDIAIIRPVAWTDIRRSAETASKNEYYQGNWNDLPIYFPTYYFLPKVGLPTNGLMYYLSIRKTFNALNFVPDIFYTTWAYPDAYAAMLLARKHHKKYFLRVHGSDINDLAFRKSIGEKVHEVLTNAEVIISPSQALKEKMIGLKIPAGKIHVIYSGVDKTRFHFQERASCEVQLGLEGGKRRILYIGNLKKAKGAMDLLLTVNYLKDELENFETLFIGKGEDLGAMQQYISHNQLNNYVRIIGPVDHHLLSPWINSSDCVCLPSYAEGMPNVLLEALACKTKIVATRVGGIPELLTNGDKFFVRPGDPVQLKNVLKQVLTNPDETASPAIPIKSYREISNQITGLIHQALN